MKIATLFNNFQEQNMDYEKIEKICNLNLRIAKHKKKVRKMVERSTQKNPTIDDCIFFVKQSNIAIEIGVIVNGYDTSGCKRMVMTVVNSNDNTTVCTIYGWSFKELFYKYVCVAKYIMKEVSNDI